MDLRAVGFGEGHEREYIGLGTIHELRELRELAAQLIGDQSPLRARGVERLLREGRVDRGEHHLSLALAGVGEGIAQEVHLAALPGGGEYLGGCGLQPLVRIGDHQLHATQPTARQRAQEVRPEGLGLRGPDRHAEQLAHAFGVHGHGDYYRLGDDPPGFPPFHVGRVDPQVWPVALKRAAEERVDPLVDLRAQPRHLALGDPAHPHRLHQLVHRAGGDALDIGLLDDGGQRLLGRPARLEERWEVAP